MDVLLLKGGNHGGTVEQEDEEIVKHMKKKFREGRMKKVRGCKERKMTKKEVQDSEE